MEFKEKINTWIKERPSKWGGRLKLFKDLKTNQRANWLILLLEGLLALYVLNAFWGCPCAFRTCSLQHMSSPGVVDWEASNLDCSYVQEYLSKQKPGLPEKYIPQKTFNVTYGINGVNQTLQVLDTQKEPLIEKECPSCPDCKACPQCPTPPPCPDAIYLNPQQEKEILNLRMPHTAAPCQNAYYECKKDVLEILKLKRE